MLDDASSHTLPYDSVNSRVFDALASGAVVLTNCSGGVRELFDADFPTYADASSLRVQLDRLLADEVLRRGIAARYRDEVLHKHTYAHRARQLKELLQQRLENLRFCITIGAPAWDVADKGGDVRLARAIQRELRAHGHDALIQTADEWDTVRGLEYDVALHLNRDPRNRPRPAQLNVLWNISYPEMLTGDECDAYDLIFVGSERFAEKLRERTETPVHVLEQATDTRHFRPELDERWARDLVLVGDARGSGRHILGDLLPTEHDLAVWGRTGTGGSPSRYRASPWSSMTFAGCTPRRRSC